MRATGGVVVVILAVSLGCGTLSDMVAEQAAEQIVGAASGGVVDLNQDGDGGIEIKTGDGAMQIGNKVTLPDDLPFPILDGFQPVSKIAAGGSTLLGFSTTTLGRADVEPWMRSSLQGLGCDKPDEADLGAMFTLGCDTQQAGRVQLMFMAEEGSAERALSLTYGAPQ
jgi:hypothetical protein